MPWRTTAVSRRAAVVTSHETLEVMSKLALPPRPVVRAVVAPHVELVANPLVGQQGRELPGGRQRPGG